MKRWLIWGIILALPVLLNALEPPANARPTDTDGDGMSDQWELSNGDDSVKIYADTSGDGRIDTIQEYDDKGNRLYEALDFNADGEIDDHYFYSMDVLRRREIDSNYDGRIDIWVYLKEGVYIERYQRDTDFDGEVDLEKTFGEGE